MKIPIPFSLLLLFSTTFLLSATKVHSQTCNNWLSIPNQTSYFRIGDLDVPGNKITVEATFNRRTPWSGVDLFQGDLVSKHFDPTDCNYLLRPSSAEITTSNGYFKTPVICPIELNKTYHVAMVYDGITLKFYRNGYLMSQIAATGNLVQNNHLTQVGLLYLPASVAESFIGHINEVRIWNISRTQNELNAFMSQSLPNPQTTPGLLAYYAFDNLVNKQGNALWNGSLVGGAAISATNANCTFVADSCGTNICASAAKPDFGFNQDVCFPQSASFFSNLSNVQEFQWDFGNGQTNNSSTNPSITYNAFNTYTVKLQVKYNTGCIESTTKQVSIRAPGTNLILNPDTSICFGDSVLVRPTAPGISNCWAPMTGLNLSSPRNVIAKPLVTTTYFYSSKIVQSNLVVNGGFDNGNTGFTSGYGNVTSGTTAGTYSIGTNPALWAPAFSSCKDHTTGTGAMMIINGDQQQNIRVWTANVTVTPNKNYAFSAWVQSLQSNNPPRLQLFINGNAIGNFFNGNSQTCKWDQLDASWSSGTNTTATLTIVNMNTGVGGNDFALDDISFGEVTVQKDSIKISVDPLPVIDAGDALSVCTGNSVQLNAAVTGAASIKWSPSTYLSNANVVNPVATPLTNMKYIVEALAANGCRAADSVQVTTLVKPRITLREDTSLCKGSSVLLTSLITNASSYSWQPTAGLSNPAIANPVANPGTTTRYIITASNGACSSTDSLLISINSLPDVTVSNDTTVCEQGRVNLLATGGTNYIWTPSIGLSADNVPAPLASPLSTTKYFVAVEGANGCKKIDSVLLNIIKKPVFNVQPVAQSICLGTPTLLTATGGDVYSWTPSNTAETPNGASTRVFPAQTTTYKVYIKDLVCQLNDSVSATITVNQPPAVAVSKSNDITCSNTFAVLTATGGVAYSWSPTSGLADSTRSNPRVTPVQSTVYKVRVSDANGCTQSDSIKVHVSAVGGNAFYVPSAFTPNNDGKNDCFGVKYWGSVEDFELAVFNRFGQRVFYTNNSNNCWNGRYNNVEQGPGTYVYYIKARSLCGNASSKGTIVLIR